jgi:Flp pilus assembly protein TadG
MRRLRAERGNASIIVALMATTLIGAGALAIDLGAMMVRHSQLQAGADAAAMAIAQQCAQFVVSDQTGNCNATQALATATNYFAANLPGITADVTQPVITTYYDGRAGMVTVKAGTQDPTIFGWALAADSLDVSAAATARWGPLVAVEVFPLAVCNGALPQPDALGGPSQEVTLSASVSGGQMLGECDGASDALPLGWITDPMDPECTPDVTLVPPTHLEISPVDEPPPGPACQDEINDLLGDIKNGVDLDDIGTSEWVSPGLCASLCRSRVLAVYDASRSADGRHPSYSLIFFEFTGMRVSSREAHRSIYGPLEGACDPEDPIYEPDVVCMRGRVWLYNPPDDGPIADFDLLDIGGIDDTTVLDVRLVN